MKTYQEVAQKHGLTSQQTARYLKYMTIRWAGSERIKCETGYAGEWAERFKRGDEFTCSDTKGRAVLQGIN